jgi:arylsulfatase A-like enzyme
MVGLHEPNLGSRFERGTRRWPAVALLALALLPACEDRSESATNDIPAGVGAHGSAHGFNVLLVTLDTVRADALGCYGGSDARTPVIDRLAQHAVRFERTCAAAPITLPSHATIMTGLDPISHGVRNNGTYQLPQERVTLAEILHDHGYATSAIIGAFVLGKCYGLAQGFDAYDDAINRQVEEADEGHYLQRTADQVTDCAIAWFDHRPTAPFFLWAHYYDAHFPYKPPAKYAPPPRDPKAGWDAADNRKRYLGEVAFIDAELGRLLEHLGPDVLAHTLVVVAADHGESLGEHNEFTHSLLVYRSCIRVPLLFSCPSLFDRARVVDDRVAGLVDVMPTTLGLLGIDWHQKVDGLSLFEAPANPDRAIYGETLVPLFDHGWAPLHFLRRLRDKYIRAPRPEYYDLAADPDEHQNLYAPSQPSVRELERELSERLAHAVDAERAPVRELEPAEVRELAALGYVQAAPPGPKIGVLDPKDMVPTWAMLSNASTLADQGDFEHALSAVEQVLRIDPNDAYAWETAYVVHWKHGELDRAEECVRKMLELNATCYGYVRLAQLMFQLERLDECEAALAKAERLDPNEGLVSLVRGDLYVKRERYDAARTQYEHALQIDPVRTDAAARRGLQWLDANGKTR